jgi:hypothetical protein
MPLLIPLCCHESCLSPAPYPVPCPAPPPPLPALPYLRPALPCFTLGHGQPGYLDDPTVPEGSKCPTYAACRLFINNERWAGEAGQWEGGGRGCGRGVQCSEGQCSRWSSAECGGGGCRLFLIARAGRVRQFCRAGEGSAVHRRAVQGSGLGLRALRPCCFQPHPHSDAVQPTSQPVLLA